MTYWSACLLGIVQGLAEFLPISSSGHLAILQNFLHIGDLENHLLFDVLLHLGTLAAVILSYRTELLGILHEGLWMLHRGKMPRGTKPDMKRRRMLLFLLAASVPLVLAAIFDSYLTPLYTNTFFIGFMLILTGFLLLAADRLGHGRKNETSATLSDALVVGLAQAVAVVPGLSRSGATISAGMLRGFERSFAVRFSFLLSIPAVIGAALYTLLKAVLAGVDWSYAPMYLVGVACAFLTGLLAISALRVLVQRGKFGGFSWYCWGAGLLTLILSLVS